MMNEEGARTAVLFLDGGRGDERHGPYGRGGLDGRKASLTPPLSQREREPAWRVGRLQYLYLLESSPLSLWERAGVRAFAHSHAPRTALPIPAFM
jgi:hypothetical protein